MDESLHAALQERALPTELRALWLVTIETLRAQFAVDHERGDQGIYAIVVEPAPEHGWSARADEIFWGESISTLLETTGDTIEDAVVRLALAVFERSDDEES
ncbi:MAG: hypothetical protein M3N45_06615 [Actinomycetota bacterium]|nr:hypothetical protein [Actinomycetota bacterium]